MENYDKGNGIDHFCPHTGRLGKKNEDQKIKTCGSISKRCVTYQAKVKFKMQTTFKVYYDIFIRVR